MQFAYRVRIGETAFDHLCSYHTQERLQDGGIRRVFPRFHWADGQMTLDFIATRTRDSHVWSCVLRVTNQTVQPTRISRAQIGVALEGTEMRLDYFTSDWGSEFSPASQEIKSDFSLRCVSGRSAKGFVPFVWVVDQAGKATAMALAWSGNWALSAYPADQQAVGWVKRYALMGLDDHDGFYHEIEPGASFETPMVYLAEGEDKEAASAHLRDYFRRHLSPQGELNWQRQPVVYNSWWPFEDKYIDEVTFLANAREAKALGLDYAVLDAGWFGPEETSQGWYDKRGDWDVVNTVRFPSGLRSLCNQVKALALKPGIWCEIEAVGRIARLRENQPHLLAIRHDRPLGYLCFGSEESRVFAMGVMDKLIGEYGAQWVKIDFNLDPGPGCDCQAHGHGTGDGLLAHYRGYYAFLDALRAKYPGVVIENCASGGLRTDIGMLSHSHLGFLSDPDHTEFHLQCLWGALSFLHPSSLYHFAWSQTLQDHNLGVHDPLTSGLTRHKLDYMVRAVMIGVPGFSYDLRELPGWISDRLKQLVAWYHQIAGDFVQRGTPRRLSAQPLTGGRGERFPAFSLQAPAGDILVFAFRLHGAPEEGFFRLTGLETEQRYLVEYLDAGTCQEASGRELLRDGIILCGLPEEASEVIHIRRA